MEHGFATSRDVNPPPSRVCWCAALCTRSENFLITCTADYVVTITLTLYRGGRRVVDVAFGLKSVFREFK